MIDYLEVRVCVTCGLMTMTIYYTFDLDFH